MIIDDLKIYDLEKARNRILTNLIHEKLLLSENSTDKKVAIKASPHRTNATRELNLRRIIEIIVEYNIFGINHEDLAKKIKINTKNLRKYMRILIDEKVVIRYGKKGAYKISPIFSIFYNRYKIENNDFRQRLVELLSEYESLLWVLTENTDISLDIRYVPVILDLLEKKDEKMIKKFQKSQKRKDELDLRSFKKFLIERSKGISEEETLFRFSNTIGFIFTYLCLFALNPKNNIAKYAQNDKEKDLLVMLWIYDMVSKFCLEWFQQFTFILPDTIKSLSRIDTPELEQKVENLIHPKGKSCFIYDSKTIEEVQNTLKNTYPHLFQKCEFIFNEEPKIRLLYKQKEEFIVSCEHNDNSTDEKYITYDKISPELDDGFLFGLDDELSWFELEEEVLRKPGPSTFHSSGNLPFESDKIFLKHCQRCHRNIYSKI